MRNDLVLLGTICAAFGLAGGPPYAHPDFVVAPAFRAILNYGNPQFFSYPGLVIYLNALAYGATYLAMHLVGLVSRPAGFIDLYYQGYLITSPVKIPFFFPGHLVTVAFSVVGVLATYLLARRLTGNRVVSLLAGFFVSSSLMWTANSHFLTVDIPMASLSAATVYAALRFAEADVPFPVRRTVTLGVMLGLTASAKYPGALAAVGIAALMIVAYRGFSRALVRDLFLLGVVSVVAFAVLNPYALLDFRHFARDFGKELYYSRHARTVIPEFNIPRYNTSYLQHIVDSLYWGYGLLPLVLAAVGMVWAMAARRLSLLRKVALFCFPVFYYLIVGNSKVAAARYMLPVIPFLGIFSALGAYAVYEAGGAFIRGRVRRLPTWLAASAAALVTVLALAPGITASVRHDVIIGRTDTRQMLARALRGAAIDRPLVVYSDGYTAREVRRSGVPLAELNTDGIKLGFLLGRIEQRLCDDFDMIVVNSFSWDRIFRLGMDPHGYMRTLCDDYDSLFVVQISPYTVPKDGRLDSPNSAYGPYLPDLSYRSHPGPFIEVYAKADIIRPIVRSCERNGVAYAVLPAFRGHYFRKDPSALPASVRGLRPDDLFPHHSP